MIKVKRTKNPHKLKSFGRYFINFLFTKWWIIVCDTHSTFSTLLAPIFILHSTCKWKIGNLIYVHVRRWFLLSLQFLNSIVTAVYVRMYIYVYVYGKGQRGWVFLLLIRNLLRWISFPFCSCSVVIRNISSLLYTHKIHRT